MTSDVARIIAAEASAARIRSESARVIAAAFPDRNRLSLDERGVLADLEETVEIAAGRADSGGVYRRYADALADAVVIFDCTTDRLVFFNAAYVALLGYDSAEEIKPETSFWTPAARAFYQRVMPLRRAAFARGERRRYVDELALSMKSGASVWVETRTVYTNDELTGNLLACAVCRPLDRADDDGPTLLDELQALGNIGAWTMDPVAVEGRWTEQLARIHDASPGDDMVSAMSNFTLGGASVLRERLTETLQTGDSFTVELPIRTTKGNDKWLRIAARAMFEHGQPIRIRGMAQDITRRKRVELELAAERALMQALLNHLPDIISLRDVDGRILACNARLEQYYGVGPGELIGRRDSMPVGAVTSVQKTEEWVTFKSDGHRELVEIVTAPVHSQNGALLGILRIGRDITAARAAEEQLRAVQKMEAIGRLAGGVAHDFNNLLSVILSYTNLAMETLPPHHPLQEDFAEILAAGKRGESLTRQLLTFSRRQLLHMAPLVLADVVETTGNMLRRLIGEDIELRIVRVGEPLSTKVDRGQIEQVLTNLVVNARDAMPSGGKLSITISSLTLDEARAMPLDLPAGDYAELVVEDSGIGMDASTLARVFEPFFTTKRSGRGTGLGLAMAYGIIRQSGGAITVTSTPKVGTTVRILLPRYEAPREGRSPKPPAPAKVHGHERVLVVEDEDQLRSVARRILKGAGYDVLTAANAEEALRIARDAGDSIDLVFTDVVMPGMNGGELVERLVAQYPRLKVIFTSGYTDEKLARSGVGEHRFLPKPWEPAQLTATIRAVLDANADQRNLE